MDGRQSVDGAPEGAEKGRLTQAEAREEGSVELRHYLLYMKVRALLRPPFD